MHFILIYHPKVCRLEHIGFTNYIIFAADDPLYDKLVKIKGPVFHFRIKGTKVGHLFHQQLWLNRWRLMAEVTISMRFENKQFIVQILEKLPSYSKVS